MKKSRLAVGLILSLVTVLSSSCAAVQPVREIVFSDETTEYTTPSHEAARSALVDFVVAIYGQRAFISATMKGKIETYCAEIEEYASEKNVSESAYNAYFAYMAEHKQEIAQKYKAYQNGECSLMDCFGELVDRTISTFGVRVLTKIVRETVLFDYDNKISEAKQDMIENKNNPVWYEHFSEKEKTYLRERHTFAGIAEDSMKDVIKSVVMLYKIYGGSGEGHDLFDNFSNGELSLFLRNLSFNVNLSVEEWELFFNLFQKLGEDAETFFQAVIAHGHTEALARSFNGCFALVDELFGGVESERLQPLRDGDTEGFFAGVFENFTPSQWARLEEILSVSLKEEEFQRVMEKSGVFEEVASFSTLEDLKTCQKGDYLSTLKAVAYGVFYDKT